MKKIIFLMVNVCFILFCSSIMAQKMIRTWKILNTNPVTKEEALQYISELNKNDTSIWRIPKNSECVADKDIIKKLENFKYNTRYLIMLYYTEDDNDKIETGEWNYAAIIFHDIISSPEFIDGYGYSPFLSKENLLLVSESPAPSQKNKNDEDGGGCFINYLKYIKNK